MGYLYPYGDTSQLNLDWILAKIKELENNIGTEISVELETIANALISATYDPLSTSGYALQDIVFNNDALWRCNTAIPAGGEPWDSSHWDQIYVGPTLSNLVRAVSGMGTDDIQNDSNVAGVHATDALNNLDTAVSGLQSAINAFHVWHVNADGTGDFTTISAAVSAASDGNTILIHPGTYTESIKANAKKLNFVGVDRETCILQYSGLDYANPPLEIAKGSVKNLTINCLNSGTPAGVKAYCAHIDNDNSTNQTLIFENVKFYNPVHQAVGIGLRHNFALSFINCWMESIDQSALYCHDWETADAGADKSNQKLIVENTVIKNNSSSHATIQLQSQELATDCAECTFVGCAVYNLTTAATIAMFLWGGRTLTNNSFMGSSDWVLGNMSALNTVKELKAVGYPINDKDLPWFYNIEKYYFNSSTPAILPVKRFNGAFLICNWQNEGFLLLTVYHTISNTVDAYRVVQGTVFTPASPDTFTLTCPDNDTMKFETTYANPNYILLIRSGNFTS